jgi:hypothetical protein
MHGSATMVTPSQGRIPTTTTNHNSVISTTKVSVTEDQNSYGNFKLDSQQIPTKGRRMSRVSINTNQNNDIPSQPWL